MVVLLAGAAFERAPASGTGGIGAPENYDVVWLKPGMDHTGSMPAGNGDIGINAWVEESGDLVFYISKTDAWDDYGRLVKVGKVRISVRPDLRVSPGLFRQRLNLADGTILVQAGEA
jgi:alpha-L-fucosidase 2